MIKKSFTQWLGGKTPNKSNDSEVFPWIALENLNQLTKFEEATDATHRVIFKHSTRCGISSMMLRRFEASWRHCDANIEFYLLDLIRFRSVSDAIAHQFKVSHQSPQVIVLQAGKVVRDASHGEIGGIVPESIA